VDDELDIFQVHDEITEDALESLAQIEANEANHAAQILFDALVRIVGTSTESSVITIATDAIEMVTRDE